MEFTGKLLDASYNLHTGKYNVTFEAYDSKAVTGGVDAIRDCDRLHIKAVKYRESRSPNANAYAWVLMQKIAEVIKSDKWSVYLKMLERYSTAFTHVIVKEQALERTKELYRTYIDLGEVMVNGKQGHQLQVYFGSSTFDTKEMSVFIDGIIMECRELGIETLPPNELERMKSEWQRS